LGRGVGEDWGLALLSRVYERPRGGGKRCTTLSVSGKTWRPGKEKKGGLMEPTFSTSTRRPTRCKEGSGRRTAYSYGSVAKNLKGRGLKNDLGW